MYYKVKQDESYPWSCESDPNRKMDLFTDDVLQKNENGTYTKLTGICCCNIVIPENDIEPIEKEIKLRMV